MAAMVLVVTASCAAPSVAPAVHQAPVTVNGSGIENSAPFSLAAGDYLVEWAATTERSCFHGGDLKGIDNDDTEYLVSEMLEGDGSGTTYAYDLSGGTYYLRASSGCGWTFRFTRQ
jgi:hypothetical protein